MKINLKRLSLTNFKGIRSLTINFDQVTNIHGMNATGKTTIFDAFLWLFFGKDSTDRKDFEIKTLDENNQPFHKLDHEVYAIIEADGEVIHVKKSMREKWQTKRGTSEAEFKGHENSFFWNDVPCKLEEYQAKIAGMLNENVFKLITNTSYFNSMKWQERRQVLIQLGGNISNVDVLDRIATISNKQEIMNLTAVLNSKKTIDEYKREIASKKTKIKNELELLPSRIDEANRSLPDPINYDEIIGQVAKHQVDIETIDGLMMNKTQAQKDHQKIISELLNEKNGYNHQIMQIEFDAKNSVKDKRQQREQVIADKKRELNSKRDEKSRLTNDYLSEERRKKAQESVKAELVAKWEEINKEQLVFNDAEFSCPACKRAYESSDIESKKTELINNFNTDKSRRLSDVTDRGNKLKEDIFIIEAKLTNITASSHALNAEMEVLQTDIGTLEEEHTRLSANEGLEIERSIATNDAHKKLKAKITLLDEQINTPFNEGDNSSSLARKRELNTEIDALKNKLATKEQREKILNRITELKKSESEMAQQLADLERTEFCIEQFTKAKMDELENRINGKFKLVRFKMFEEQINGGLAETCLCLINGVPYPDANTASKVQAGLDIINTISDFYGTKAPIFIDNRESVVNIPESDSQIINLIVSANDKKLRIETSAMALATA